jgi:phosphomannomutase
MPGQQHAGKSADVGVPDIAIAIDGDAERPGMVAAKRKSDVAVAQPSEACAA